MNIVSVDPGNVLAHSLFCAKNPKKNEFKAKQRWFEREYENGLRLCILKNEEGKGIGYIEFTPAEFAWRPVKAPDYLFIHCMYTYSNKDKGNGYASQLIQYCVEEAKKLGKSGVCAFASKGSWVADKRIFEKNGFEEIDRLDRFELMSLQLEPEAEGPKFIDWTQKSEAYTGWHLTYADQCPWHHKSAHDLKTIATEQGIDLHVKKLESHEDAQNAPSGFGGFNLIYNGQLLEDHYISGTRFKNIIKSHINL